MRYPRRYARPGNSFEHERGGVVIRNMPRSDQSVAVFGAELTALSSRECESEGAPRMDLDTGRRRETRVTDATGLHAANENRAVRKNLGEGDPVAAGEHVPRHP